MTTTMESQGLSSIGGPLREARISAARSIEDVADALGIRTSYLEALEADALGGILGPAYVESMAVRYAMLLDLDPEDFMLSVARGVGGSPDGVSVGLRDERPAAPPPSGPPLTTPSALPEPVASPDPSALPARPARRARPAVPRSRKARRTPVSPGKRGRAARSLVVLGLTAALLVVAVGGGAELGLFSLFGGESTAGERSGVVVAAAATDDQDATTTVVTTARVEEVDLSADAKSTAVAGAASAVLMATTTTLAPGPADPPADGRPAAGSAGGSFTFAIDASDEAWLEVRDAGSGEALHVGALAKGGSLRLEVAGPIHVTVGRPEVLSAKIDGQAAALPNAFRWLVTAAGVEVRS